MDIKISSECGQLALLEREIPTTDESSRPSGGGTKTGAHSNVGVILKVPLPEFDVRGNASLVLALGGLQGYTIDWVSQGEARINDVPVFLPDSIIFCIFRMPRDGAAGAESMQSESMQSLWLSPSILDFVKDIQGLHRKHLHPFITKSHMNSQPKRSDAAHPPPPRAVPAAAAPELYTLPALGRRDAEPLEGRVRGCEGDISGVPPAVENGVQTPVRGIVRGGVLGESAGGGGGGVGEGERRRSVGKAKVGERGRRWWRGVT